MTGSGGSSGSRSVEALKEDGSSLCSFPDLPGEYVGHSQTGLEVCGSFSNRRSCLSFTSDGVWEEIRKLSYPRHHHSSWSSPYGLLLMGGNDDESLLTTELITESGSTRSFSLKYKIR